MRTQGAGIRIFAGQLHDTWGDLGARLGDCDLELDERGNPSGGILGGIALVLIGSGDFIRTYQKMML